MATFYLAPGYHELTLQSGEICPAVSFESQPGAQYYFRADYEYVVSPTSLRDLKISLSMDPNPGNDDDLRAVPIDSSKLTDILAQCNPSGQKPTDATSSDANALPSPEASSISNGK
jgi:hypothetical protein